MIVSMIVLWAFVGICPDLWWIRRPPRWPWPITLEPPPRAGPDPDPRPFVSMIAGAVGGIAGGWVYTKVFGEYSPQSSLAVYAAATSLGAVIGSLLLSGVLSLVMGGRTAPANVQK